MLNPPLRVSSVITCSKNDKSMRLPLTIETSKQTIGTQALVDSGAEGIFINRRFARDNWLPTQPLGHTIVAKNVDDTVNKQGIIDRYVDLEVDVGGKKQKERFLVTDLGQTPIILGLPWLAKHNPRIDWSARQVELEDGKGESIQDIINPPILRSLTIAAKTNTAMDLAQKYAAAHQDQRTVEDIVPGEY